MTMPASYDAPKETRRYTVKDEKGAVIGKAELRRVPVHAIKLDPGYQRDTSSEWVALHGPFDARQAGAIVLSSRAGGPYCIDGGHRLALAKSSGEEFINSFVIDGLSRQDEARLFTRYQRDRRNLTSWALFRADQIAGDPDTLAMVRIVNNAGFRLSKTAGGPNDITAVDSVRYVQKYGGDDLLSRTLSLVGKMWVGEEKALSGPVIKGLALFLQSAGQQPQFSRDYLERVMTTHGPMKVLRLSQSIAEKRRAVSAGPANFAEALLEEYNKVAKDDKLGPLTIGSKRRPAARSK